MSEGVEAKMSQLLDQHINLGPFGPRNICLAHSCPNISLVTPFYELGLKLLDEDFTAVHSGHFPAARSLNCNMGTWENQEKATHGGHTTLPAKLCSSHVSNTHKGGVLSETSWSADVPSVYLCTNYHIDIHLERSESESICTLRLDT